MKIDLKKPITTRDGRPVRILATDVSGFLPNGSMRGELRHDLILGLIRNSDGTDETKRWKPEGFDVNGVGVTNPGDLVNVKIKKWQWAYLDGPSFVTRGGVTVMHYASKHEAHTALCDDEKVIVGRILETEIEE